MRGIAHHILLGGLAACSATRDPPEVVDTSGARFAWVCDEHCTPETTESTPPLPPCKTGRPLYVWSFNRFINIAAACADSDGWSSSTRFERPLACDDTLDCPQFTNASFECRNGICQNTDTATFPPTVVTWSQANALCYASFAREATFEALNDTTLQIYAWVQAACPDMTRPCTLPLPGACLQP